MHLVLLFFYTCYVRLIILVSLLMDCPKFRSINYASPLAVRYIYHA
jgi:hypothetical protein